MASQQRQAGLAMSAPAETQLRARFLDAMSRAATSVTVVTTDGPAGRSGLTVSAMSSVSADGERPTLLVCINNSAASAAPIATNGVICVNLLRHDQSHVSDTFASQRGTDKFACADWTSMPTGAPRLVDALVAFDCRLLDSRNIGSHQVLFAAVQDVHVADGGAPLLYSNRAYGAFQAGSAANQAAGIHRRIRKFNTRDTYPEQKLDNDLCQAVVARGDMVFVRGQVGQDLDTAENVAIGDVTGQAEQAMANIAKLLQEAGGGLEHVCKITIYLTDPRYREAVYLVVGKWLKGVFPVSTGIVVSALARPEWLVEIDVIAMLGETGT
jgi:flavin reductase (DIM6/NTAB) family NADH-FMN oxidoreductase RutF